MSASRDVGLVIIRSYMLLRISGGRSMNDAMAVYVMTAVNANKACLRLVQYCRRQDSIGGKKSAKRETVKVAKCEGCKTFGAMSGQLW